MAHTYISGPALLTLTLASPKTMPWRLSLSPPLLVAVPPVAQEDTLVPPPPYPEPDHWSSFPPSSLRNSCLTCSNPEEATPPCLFTAGTGNCYALLPHVNLTKWSLDKICSNYSSVFDIYIPTEPAISTFQELLNPFEIVELNPYSDAASPQLRCLLCRKLSAPTSVWLFFQLLWLQQCMLPQCLSLYYTRHVILG